MRKETEKASRKRRRQKPKNNVIEFPLAEIKSVGGVEVTPLQLLGLMLKCVLKDRITDQEVGTICSTYYKTINDWWE